MVTALVMGKVTLESTEEENLRLRRDKECVLDFRVNFFFT